MESDALCPPGAFESMTASGKQEGWPLKAEGGW